ncbi:hypothetical protein J9253_07060 [Thiothrix litoralis]|uniref:YD repeat-containing protein n=1 Tax=Thiothrix litoralis TaxID=2891210 RepID=A0ABX7WWK7_9GAMM|nr:DUF6156 family protein [Thiothrix litoralis]QTR47671.1 hypothetical protein J9253_07060 [Thiothrix litoralis]
MDNEKSTCRYFTTYSGVKLPFKLVGELGEHEIRNRNTFFRGYFDAEGVLLGFQKVVYGDVELEHKYTYRKDGMLQRADITDAEGEMDTILLAEQDSTV